MFSIVISCGAGFADCEDTTCGPGEYIGGDCGCVQCPVGYYKEGTNNATSCTKCPKGTYADNTGSATCSSCAEGTYADETGMEVCKNCPVGYCCTLENLFVCKQGTWSNGGLACQKHSVQYYNNNHGCSIEMGSQQTGDQQTSGQQTNRQLKSGQLKGGAKGGGTCSTSIFVYEEGMCESCNGPCTTSGEGAKTSYACTEKTVKNVTYNGHNFSWPNDGSVIGLPVTSAMVDFGNQSCPSPNNNN